MEEKADGIALSELHIKGIKGSKTLTTMKQVQQILGKLDYYRQFMPMISLHQVELQKLVNVSQLPNSKVLLNPLALQEPKRSCCFLVGSIKILCW